MRLRLVLSLSLSSVLLSASAPPQQITWPPAHPPGPWSNPDAIIVPDPYEGNAFDFDKAFADKKVKAVIFRAAQGLTVDKAVYARAKEAKQRGIPFGIYLLGMSSQPWTGAGGKVHSGLDPIAQADLLVKIGHETGANALALDIEGLKSPFMSPSDAERAITRIHARSNPQRYPLFYANKSTAAGYAKLYDANSVFAHTPLWLAGLPGYTANRIWANYALLQFGAEWDCAAFLKQFPENERRKYATQANCGRYTRYPIAGSRYDLDVNVLRGGPAQLAALFGSPQQ